MVDAGTETSRMHRIRLEKVSIRISDVRLAEVEISGFIPALLKKNEVIF